MTRWWIIGAAMFFAALLIASVVLALMSKETEFAPGTPEHAVQSLLRAAEDDDLGTAYDMLSNDLRRKCELNDFANGGYHFNEDRDFRAILRGTKLVDDTTFVTVKVTRFYGEGPFDRNESSYDRRFALQQEGGEWKFIEYSSSYDYCRESDTIRDSR